MAKPPPIPHDGEAKQPEATPPSTPSSASAAQPGFTTRLRTYFRPGSTSSSPLEARLLLKIDFFILTFCCLSYFLNYLDRTALSNAYVSGMKESLSFRGSQLNQINTCFTIGYVLGQVPSNLSLHYIAPRIFFPSMMVLWAGLTMVTAAAKSPGQIMAIRFFQGIAESTTFVGTHYILGSWYTEKELGKRSGVFTASGLAGTMIGGFVQSGIHASMDGLHGLAGWRWLFIVDGIITLPVAIYGFLLFPDTPKTTRAPYLSSQERELAIRRMEEKGEPGVSGPCNDDTTLVDTSTGESSCCWSPPSTAAATGPAEASSSPTKPLDNNNDDNKPTSQPRPAPPPPSTEPRPQQQQQQQQLTTHPFSLVFLRSLFSSYHFPSFILLWILAGETESFSSNALLSLYLKSHPASSSSSPEKKYTISQLNTYPTGVPAVGILSTLFFAFFTDLYPRHRSIVGYFIGVIGVLTPSLILAAQAGRFGPPAGNHATAVVMAAYYLAGSVYACQATFFAWANDAMTRDGKEAVFRAVVLAGMNLGSNAVNAWWSIVFYGAGMAPWFERGMWAMVGTSVAVGGWTACLEVMERRAWARKKREGGRERGGDASAAGQVIREKGTAYI
ncbi:major facilitator superfamily domain-containing protein [Pseudoneurospora amorphoporcata]|uniref:Major facilitator superfamily domain-containing protein n=1 Tax=Pseudoneurospora amorphoporcata TaxID=241081 RepID=A0AAN6NQ69_9PEZI|nr:major facilitator superfamily domain-containing protein [Pseudoneurospora amorphoporcata]